MCAGAAHPVHVSRRTHVICQIKQLSLRRYLYYVFVSLSTVLYGPSLCPFSIFFLASVATSLGPKRTSVGLAVNICQQAERFPHGLQSGVPSKPCGRAARWRVYFCSVKSVTRFRECWVALEGSCWISRSRIKSDGDILVWFGGYSSGKLRHTCLSCFVLRLPFCQAAVHVTPVR